MKKLHLLAAGGVTVALFAFQVANGNISLPSAVTSLFAEKSEPLGLKQVSTAPTDSTPSEGISREPGVDANGVAAPGADTPTFDNADVNVRIAQAVELSKNLEPAVTPGAAPASAKSIPRTVSVGTWQGKYTGPDAGTLTLQVGQDGAVTGFGASTMTGIQFSITGKVLPTGKIELTQAADLSNPGTTFVGSALPDGTAAGTWEAKAYNLSGSWQVTLTAPLAPAQ